MSSEERLTEGKDGRKEEGMMQVPEISDCHLRLAGPEHIDTNTRTHTSPLLRATVPHEKWPLSSLLVYNSGIFQLAGQMQIHTHKQRHTYIDILTPS